MRTITEKFAKRLLAQAKEAKLQGLTKVADHVSVMVEAHDIRADDASYVYSGDDVQNDVENALWVGAVRAADFFDCSVDAKSMQQVIAKFAEQLIDEVRMNAGISHGVGAYEPSTPGETFERVTIEVDE